MIESWVFYGYMSKVIYRFWYDTLQKLVKHVCEMTQYLLVAMPISRHNPSSARFCSRTLTSVSDEREPPSLNSKCDHTSGAHSFNSFPYHLYIAPKAMVSWDCFVALSKDFLFDVSWRYSGRTISP